ncbi:hypothetical protein Tdes44962_MAKER06222 [Teratosphaeria destructans]|uniref:Uncharacterized protein n=1 Tax=Teratosphaeria destructans TaxID=418781 RepID=A0A9W7SHV9_9PEZI|nr:hypothetical protein Tdes44962_MAKER06222 [Teratosphaeria destructans]
MANGLPSQTAKNICTSQEIERLACTLLNSQEVTNVSPRRPLPDTSPWPPRHRREHSTHPSTNPHTALFPPRRNHTDRFDQIDWTAAAAQWGGDVKPDSYKTFISRLTKKIREAKGKGTTSSDDASSAAVAGPAKGKGKKRKAAAGPADGAAEEENDDQEKPAAKKGKGKAAGAKKVKKGAKAAVEHGESFCPSWGERMGFVLTMCQMLVPRTASRLRRATTLIELSTADERLQSRRSAAICWAGTNDRSM